MSYHANTFGIHTTVADGNCLVLELTGDIDLTSAPRLREALLRTLNTHDGPLVVDFAQVGFIDSSGLNALVAGYRRARQLGRPYAVSSLQPNARKLFAMTALDSLISIHDTAAGACDHSGATTTSGRLSA